MNQKGCHREFFVFSSPFFSFYFPFLGLCRRFCANKLTVIFSLRSYNKWITDIAEADTRLITTLRRIRSGEFVYGKETGQAPLLQSLCEDLGLPRVWGDPAVTKRIPCEVCIRLLTAIPFFSSCMKSKFQIPGCFCFFNEFLVNL